jgi:hypothetical protein
VVEPCGSGAHSVQDHARERAQMQRQLRIVGKLTGVWHVQNELRAELPLGGFGGEEERLEAHPLEPFAFRLLAFGQVHRDADDPHQMAVFVANGRVATAESGLGNPDVLATIARVAVWAFAILVAVNQIGIATTIVNTLFMATVGAVALAFALAFGLGGRETAAQIVQHWYQSGQQAGPRLSQAAEAASSQTQQGAGASNRMSSSSTPVSQPTR